MLLLSRFLPRIFQKTDKKKTVVDDNDNDATVHQVQVEKGKLCQCKVLLLDDTELAVSVKVCTSESMASR